MFIFLEQEYTSEENNFAIFFLSIFSFFIVLISKAVFSKNEVLEGNEEIEETEVLDEEVKTSFSSPSPSSFASSKTHHLLLKFFPYYANLDNDLQYQFLLRVTSFLNTKEIIPRQGTEIPGEMPLLIAAASVQLTFGLVDYSFFSFDKILIYPTAYYSNIRKVYHQGEINIKHRLIVLSATHFLGGLSDPHDGRNLGLHELAHALNIHAFDYQDYEFIERFKDWEAIALVEMTAIQRGHHFLRPYASKNIHEMFAVCVESFFERPQEFQQKLPQLFSALVILLRQNPLHAKRPI